MLLTVSSHHRSMLVYKGLLRTVEWRCGSIKINFIRTLQLKPCFRHRWQGVAASPEAIGGAAEERHVRTRHTAVAGGSRRHDERRRPSSTTGWQWRAVGRLPNMESGFGSNNQLMVPLADLPWSLLINFDWIKPSFTIH